MKYYNFIGNVFGGNYVDWKIYKSISSINSCDEEMKNKATMRLIGGTPQVKSCRWLLNRKRKRKKKLYCNKNFKADDMEPARVMCPATCCSCKERSDNLFLKEASVSYDGFLTIEQENCSWLQQASAEARKQHCNGKEVATYIGGYPPAHISCPETCGNCDFK